MARLQQTQRKRVGSVPRLPDDVVAAIAAEVDPLKKDGRVGLMGEEGEKEEKMWNSGKMNEEGDQKNGRGRGAGRWRKI
ncbi:hypothetical protein AgCh_020974 [Apium graveolens]